VNSGRKVAVRNSPFTIHHLELSTPLRESHVDVLASTKLPREPIFKVFFECLKVKAEAHFDQAIGYGKTFIKGRAPGKTPHEEAIQPSYGAGP